jgi:hypothetical protein
MSELDAALLRLQRTAPEYGPGLASHGPMVCEALVALRHEALIPAWLERGLPRLPPLAGGRPLARAEQARALGDASRLPDWIASYEAELGERPWREVLAEAAAVLAPGLFASAGHGWLRTAHAVRALAQCESPARLRELAFGLGLWAARYRTLPGEPGRGAGPPPRLADLVPLPASARCAGLFVDAVGPLATHEPFARFADALDPVAADPDEILREACREAAALYLAHPGARIAYAHAVTLPSALRLAGAYLAAPARGALLAFALQAAGALHAVSASRAREPIDAAERAAAERLADDVAAIRYRAACSLDDHAVKLAEACLREDALAPDPRLRLAAADAALHLGGPQRLC